MTPEQFEKIFEKVKSEPELIERLKSLIISLALNGELIKETRTLENVKNDVMQCTQVRGFSSPSTDEFTNLGILVPENWVKMTVGDICDFYNGFAFSSQNYVSAGIPIVRIGDLQNGSVILTNAKKISPKIASNLSPDIWVPRGALLIAMSGATTGKTAIKSSEEKCLLNQRVGRLKPKGINEKFFKIYFDHITERNLAISFGTAQPNLSKNQIMETPIALPSIETQELIVAKVDELMTLCDELENTNQKTNRTKLTYLKSLTKNISDGAFNKDKQSILASAFAKAPKNTEGIRELKKVCINFGIKIDQQSDKENKRFFEKLQELTDRMKVNKLLPKSFLIRHLESELLSTLSNLSLGSIAFIEKGKTGIKSAEPGEYPLVVTAAERRTCKSYDFETDAAIVPLVSSTGHGHASIHRLHFQSGRFALGTILAAVIPFDEELFSSRFIYEYLTTFKEELLVSRMTGTANVTLSVSKIGEVPIPIISSKTQKWICEFCKICDQLAISYKKESSIQDDLLKKLIA